jgi:selenide, water dikinase
MSDGSKSSREKSASVKLTQTVQKGGCAAKVAAHELRQILSQVRFPTAPKELLVGAGTFDDAAIFNIKKFLDNGDTALVQTLDFFTPIVDSAYLFGAIAATNSLSDVYAMGGDPITAMGILAFPLATLDTAIAVEVLQGASDVLQKANVPLVGGHSIDDDTLKFGLSITGIVNPNDVWSNAGAREGDFLILTKALGTGTLTAGLKQREFTEADIEEAMQSMMQLNQVKPDLVNTSSAVHAATDITGFGLAGHAMQMAKASGVTFQFQVSKLPILHKALDALEKGFLTKAHRTNFEYTKDSSSFEKVSELQKKILFDPQTSGGLLLSVSADEAEIIVKQLKKNFPHTCIIGQVLQKKNEDLIWGT